MVPTAADFTEEELTEAGASKAGLDRIEEYAVDPPLADGTKIADTPEWEKPPQYRQASSFSPEQLARAGLSPQQILELTGAARSGENSQVLQRMERPSRTHPINAKDWGNLPPCQDEALNAYFRGEIPRGDGKMVKRYRYMATRKETVLVNGYPFDIPPHVPVTIPEEAILIMEDAARSRQDKHALSAALAAMQFEPVDARVARMRAEGTYGDAQGFAAQQAADYNSQFRYAQNTSESMMPQ